MRSKFEGTRPHAHLYNSRRWRKRRAAQLQAHPLCAICQRLGATTVATVADHVEPHRGDEVKFWNGELQSLCAICHDGAKQQYEATGRMRGCDVDGIPLDPQLAGAIGATCIKNTTA